MASSAKGRLDSIPSFKKLQFKFGGYKIRYAWVSQRGYYPDDLNKLNQDAHCVVENFGAGSGMEARLAPSTRSALSAHVGAPPPCPAGARPAPASLP